MNLEEENIDQVARYLSTDMTVAEQDVFKENLETDQALREEYSFQKSIIEEVREADRLKAKDELRSLLDKHKGRQPASLLSMAAVLALLFFAGITVFYFQDNSIDQLERFYVAFPEAGIERGNDTISQSTYAYASGDYAGALPGLLQLESKSPNRPSLQMMIGSSYLMLKDFSEALKWFAKIEAGNNQLMRQHAMWYESLVLIKVGRTDEAKERLNTLSEQNKYYDEQIKELMKLL